MAERHLLPRVYPIAPLPDDPRFTFGLTYEITQVLALRGYPPIVSGLDFVELRQTLFRFLYGTDLPTDLPTEFPTDTGTVAGEEC